MKNKTHKHTKMNFDWLKRIKINIFDWLKI